MSASVRVMKSFDYCHFEVCLGSDTIESTDMMSVESMMRDAQRLSDKAIAEYKVAKEAVNRSLQDKDFDTVLHRMVEEMKKRPECERGPDAVALMKAVADHDHRMGRAYEYPDPDYDPDEDNDDDHDDD